MRIIISILAMAFLAGQALAEENHTQDFAPMFAEVAEHWQIPENWTVAIAKTESGLKPWALNIEGQSLFFDTKEEAMEAAQVAFDAGRSFDCGLMQVNSFWLKKYDIPLEAIFDSLANIYMGGFILKEEIKRHGENEKALGAYHSPNVERARVYADMVLSFLEHGPVTPVAAVKIAPAPTFISTEPMLIISPRTDTVREWGFKVFSVKKEIERNSGVID